MSKPQPEFRVESPKGEVLFESDDLFAAFARLKKEAVAVLISNKTNTPLALVGELKRPKRKAAPKKDG